MNEDWDNFYFFARFWCISSIVGCDWEDDMKAVWKQKKGVGK